MYVDMDIHMDIYMNMDIMYPYYPHIHNPNIHNVGGYGYI